MKKVGADPRSTSACPSRSATGPPARGVTKGRNGEARFLSEGAELDPSRRRVGTIRSMDWPDRPPECFYAAQPRAVAHAPASG